MHGIGRGIIAGVALAFAALAAYQFAYLVWGVLDLVPAEYFFGGVSLMLLIAWVAYARWLWSWWRRDRQARQVRREKGPDLVALRGVALRAEAAIRERQRLVGMTPVQRGMAALERDLQEGRLKGGPGSVAAASIGLDAIDDMLEG